MRLLSYITKFDSTLPSGAISIPLKQLINLIAFKVHNTSSILAHSILVVLHQNWLKLCRLIDTPFTALHINSRTFLSSLAHSRQLSIYPLLPTKLE